MNPAVTEAIILAGGFGTRLQHIVNDVPKPMAPINDKPFLTILLNKLAIAGIKHVVLSTGYKHENIASYFGNKYKSLDITYSQETTPLFTGGAITLALSKINSENVFVLNGDTFFDIDFAAFQKFHFQKQTNLSIALRPVENIERYGAVKIDEQQKITGFSEKGANHGKGIINGGIYLINRKLFDHCSLMDKFSFEKEILEKEFMKQPFYGMEFNAYFIDIGIPEDYFKAQRHFELLENKRFLFLDRDGVINRHLCGNYVKNPNEFEFLPGVLKAFPFLAAKFNRIIIVSNQQGVGKGIFSTDDLEQIHHYMMQQIIAMGGRIDGIYICPDLVEANSPNRKPQIGMALQAQHDFPEIDFNQAIMVGDALSDLEFGSNAGMQTVFLNYDESTPLQVFNHTPYVFYDLQAFTQYIANATIHK